MAIKFEKIVAGMTLYDRHRTGMGNTTLTELGEWSVKVVSVNHEARTAVVRWNGNPERVWSARQLIKLFTWSMYDDDECERITGSLGRVRSIRKRTKKEKAERAKQGESRG